MIRKIQKVKNNGAHFLGALLIIVLIISCGRKIAVLDGLNGEVLNKNDNRLVVKFPEKYGTNYSYDYFFVNRNDTTISIGDSVVMIYYKRVVPLKK